MTLFGSVVRYYVKAADSEAIAVLMFACGCHFSARLLRRRFCRRHRGQAT